MRSAGYILSGAAGMPLNITSSENYYKEHQNRINRTSIINGKVSYDLDQNKMLNDVMELGKNAFTGTVKGLYAITQNDYESFKKVEEEDFARANEYKNRINEELKNETSAFQSFVAGVPIHMLRQLVDVRQWPGIVAGQKIGGAIGAKVANSIGNTSKVGYLAGKIIGNATEEVIEEASDQLITDGELNWLGLLTAGTAGAGFSAAGSFLRGDFKGITKGSKVNPEIKAKVNAKINEDIQNFKNKAVEIGENKAKAEDVNVIADGISYAAEIKGKYINPEKIKNAGITINGTSIQTATDTYLPRVANYILKNKKVEGINNIDDFLNSVKTPEMFNKVAQAIKDVSKLDSIEAETKEAFSWFAEFLDRERVKIIDADKSRLEREVLKSLYERQGYIPIYKDNRIIEAGYPYIYSELDQKSFNAVSEVKGKKISNKVILSKIKEDLYIPENTIVKAVKNGDEVSISWEENGYKRFAKIKEENGKYRGNTYATKSSIPQKASIKSKMKDRPKPPEKEYNVRPRPEIYPTNIMEDIFGAYRLDLQKMDKVDFVKDIVKKRYGLNLKIDSKTPQRFISGAYRQLVRAVGEIDKRLYKFADIEDAVNFYRNEYGIDFKFEFTDDLDGSLGRTERIFDPETSETNYIIKVSPTQGEDYAFGILRHELEHLKNFRDNPDFKSKPIYPISKKRATDILDYLDQITGGHFEGVEGNFEYQYIVANELDNFIHNGVIDRKVVTAYNLDIPEGDDLTELGLEFIEDTIENVKAMDDSLEAMGELKKRTDKYFKLRKGMKNIFREKTDPKNIPYMVREFLNSTVVRPFRKVEEEVENAIHKIFEVNIDGNIYNMAEFLNLYHKNGGNFNHYLLDWEELPESLSQYKGQIENVKSELLNLIDGLTKDGFATREEIILSEMWGPDKILKEVLSDEDIAKYSDSYGEIDTTKFASDEKKVKDELLSTSDKIVETSPKIINARNKIADKIYKNFPSAEKTLDIMLTNVRDKATPQEIIKALSQARKCMNTKDFISTIKKHNLIEIPEIKSYLESHKSLFNDIDENKIKANRIESQKRTAKTFWTMDMASYGGTYKNPNLHTYTHKFSRFKYFLDYGLIEMDGLNKIVKSTEIEQRRTIAKLYKDMAAAYAEKEVMPGVGSRDLYKMFRDVQGSITDRTMQTYMIDAERYIEGEIGQQLGRVTKAPKTTLDTIIDTGLTGMNAIGLTGPKAFAEFFYEVPSMARDSVVRYGGKGLLHNYKLLLNGLCTLLFDKQKLARINNAIGGVINKNYASGYMNIIMDELDDPAGAKAFQVAVNGNLIQKVGYKISRGIEALNWYNITQRALKLEAYLDGGEALNRILDFNTLDDVFKNTSSNIKRLIKNLEIDENDFKIMKLIKETPTLKNDGVFNSYEFIDSLTPQKLSEIFGVEIGANDFNAIKNDIGYKAKYLYENIVSDVSPTEPENIGRSLLGTQPDPINRNFSKATMNFKSSVQTQWGRMAGSYKYANIAEGKYDWSNVAHNKRLLKHMLEVGAATAVTATLTDLDFYEDPYAEIERRVGELVDNPGSAIWYAMQDYFNTWAITTGANTVRRPMALMGQAMKGEFEKMPETVFKMSVGTANAEMLKQMYELTR